MDDITPNPNPAPDAATFAPAAIDLAEPAGPPRRSRRARSLLAATTALALGAGAFAWLGGDDDANEPVPLALQSATPNGAGAPEAASDSGRADSMMLPIATYRYVLGGTLADLGDEGPVYRLTAPALDESDVARMADALGIDGAPVALEPAGWEASDADRTLMVSGDASGWYVSVWNGPSGRLGSDDTRSSDGSIGAGGTVEPAPGAPTEPTPDDLVDPGPDTAVGEDQAAPPVDCGADPDCALVDPVPEPMPIGEGPEPEPMPVEPVPVDTMPAPTDLPDENQATTLAREALRDLGVLDGDWTFEVLDGSSMGVAVTCVESADCTVGTTEEYTIYSRSVIAHRLVDGQPVSGLDWYVEIGDRGVVTSISGLLADVELVADYPLRATTDVFADLEAGLPSGGVMPLAETDVAVGADCPPDTKCAMPDVECVDDCPEPEIVEITVTGVTRSAQVWYAGGENDTVLQYVVPMYHFTGSFADGTDWSTDLLAVDEEYVTVG